jgi:hypothetical protein
MIRTTMKRHHSIPATATDSVMRKIWKKMTTVIPADMDILLPLAGHADAEKTPEDSMTAHTLPTGRAILREAARVVTVEIMEAEEKEKENIQATEATVAGINIPILTTRIKKEKRLTGRFSFSEEAEKNSPLLFI